MLGAELDSFAEECARFAGVRHCIGVGNGDLQSAYASLGAGKGSYPIAERVSDEVLSLPIGPHLDSASQERVIETLTDVLA